MPTTASPINIFYTDPSLGESSEVESATQATSIHNQFLLRERYDFTWANDSERNAQAGMVQGSRGYQTNTKTEYLYDNSAWRLAVPYAEFSTDMASVSTATYAGVTPLTIDSSASTSTTFVTGGVGGYLTVVDPGIYSISWVARGSGGALGAPNFITISDDAARTRLYSVSPFTSNVATVAIPFLRLPVANSRLYVWFYHTSGANRGIEGILSIGRLA